MSGSLLVTGASGQLGRGVLTHLVETLGVPADRILATTRTPDALSDWADRGITVRAADFDEPETLPAAFRGADRLLLISTDSIGEPGRRGVQHANAIAAAVAAGVRHLVYTSGPDPFESKVLLSPDHADTETAISDSALPGWTVLRNHWYFENLLGNLPGVLASGRWYTATGDGRAADISRDDLALAAAHALAADFGAKRTLTLSGARAWSVAEIAALVSDTFGRPIEVVPVPVEAIVQGMSDAGVPEPIAEVLASFDTNTAHGLVAEVTDDFRLLTGREPQSFEDWLRANRRSLEQLAA